MKKHNLVFLDIETTGLNPDTHEIIELGAILVEQTFDATGRGNLRVLKEAEWKIIPEHIETADPEALRINGYSQEDWKNAVSLNRALTEFKELARGGIAVGHNVSFDLSFIEKAFRKEKLVYPLHYHKLDTISLAYAKLWDKKDAQTFSLKALCEYFGIVNEKAHTALADTRATLALYKKIFEIGEQGGLF